MSRNKLFMTMVQTQCCELLLNFLIKRVDVYNETLCLCPFSLATLQGRAPIYN